MINQLKRERQETEDKLDYQFHSCEVLEKRVHEGEVEMMNLNQVLMLEKEQAYKKDLAHS